MKNKISFSYFRFRFWRAVKHIHLHRPNKKRLLKTFFIITLAIVSQVVIFKFLKPGLASAWWDNNWEYRKRIDFGNTGAAQTDEFISLSTNTSTLITEGKMQLGCQDVRFTDSTGKQLEHRINSNEKIVFQGSSEYSSGTPQSSYSFSHTVSSGSNRMLVVVVHGMNGQVGDNPFDIDSVTFNGDSMTKQIENDSDSNSRNYATAIFTLINPDVTTANVTVTLGESVDDHVASAMTFTGVDDSTPVGEIIGNDTAGTPASLLSITDTTTYDRSILVGGALRRNLGGANNYQVRPVHLDTPGKETYSERTSSTDSDTAFNASGGFQFAREAGSHTMDFIDESTGDEQWNGAMIELKEDESTTNCNSSTTDFEVLIPNIVAGSNFVYMYYGNSDATSIESTLSDPSKYPAYKEVTEYETTTNGDTYDFNHNVTSGENQVLVVATGALHSANDPNRFFVDTVTYNGVEMVKNVAEIGTYTNARENEIELWTLINPPTGNNTVSITYDTPAASTTQFEGAALTYQYVAQDYNSVGGYNRAESTTGLDVSVTTDSNNTLIVGGAWRRHTNANNAISITSPVSTRYEEGQTEGSNDYINIAGGDLYAASNSTYTMSFSASGTGETWIGAAIALEAESTFDEFSPTSGPTTNSEEKGRAAVGFWKFDEGVDNTCPNGTSDTCDSSSSGNDGTKSGATWQAEEMCVTGKCLYFDGSDDVVTITNDEMLDFDIGLASSISASFWIRPITDGENSTGEIFDKGDATSDATYARITNEGTDGLADLEVSLALGTNGSTGDATTTITNGINLSRWNHVVLGYTDDGDDEVTIYINGKIAGASTNGSGSPESTDTNNLLIGGSSTANFHGFIDEFKIYNYERSLEEVRTDSLPGSSVRGSTAVQATDRYSYLSDGLVGYWNVNEGTGTSTTDQSGNGFTGTLTNSPTWGAGKFDDAVVFTNSTNYITAGDQTPLELNTFTHSVWVYRTGTCGTFTFCTAISKGGSSNIGYRFGLRGTGGIYYADLTLNDSQQITGTTTQLATNTWYHIAAVADEKNVRLFVNGVLEKEAARTVTTLSFAGEHFKIGNGNDGNDLPFEGRIDEARVYKKAMSASEIQNLYTWGPSPVLYYNLDENTGTPTAVFDRSGNSNNGTTAGTMTSADWVEGKLGSALDFDGSDDAIAIATASDSFVDFNGSEAFSGNAWVYIKTMPGTSNQDAIIAKYDQTSTLRGYRLVVENDDADTTGNFQVEIFDESTNQTLIATGSNDTVNENTWYHIGFSFNGGVTGSAGDLNLYTNGVLTGSNSANASFLGLEDVAVDFTIGNYDATDVVANNTAFTGVIDDVKIYNYVRSTGQVIEDMNGSYPLGGSPIGSPVSHWKFDDLEGTTAEDTSVNGNDLTLNSASWTPSGKFTGAWNGTGGNLRLSRTTDSDLEFSATDSFTISAWFKSDAASNPGATEYILANGGPSGSAGYAVYINTSGYPCFGIDDDASWGPDVSSCSTIDFYDNSWHHVTGVRDIATDKIFLYVDGVLHDSDTDSTSATLDANTTFYVGDIDTDDAVTGEEFAGDLDEIKIYRTALSENQVKIDNNSGSGINFGSGTIEASVLSDGAGNAPIGDWNLDENTGLTTYDRSGNGNDLGLTNSPTFTNGKFGNAINFAGSNQHLTRADDSDFDFAASASFTLEAWFKHGGATATETIFSKLESSGDDGGFKLKMESDGDITCETDDDDAGVTIDDTATTTAATYDDGNWHHVACVYDTTNLVLLIYVDSVLAATDASITTNSLANNEALFIGIDSATGTEDWIGDIDHPKIYNYARTQSQISYDFNRGAPIAWWRMDECLGDTIYNAKGDSTINGTRSGTSGTNTSSGTCVSGTSSHAWYNGASGKINGSLDFDGGGASADDIVTIPNSSIIDINEGLVKGFVISAWIYPESDGEGDAGYIFAKGTNNYCKVGGESAGQVTVSCRINLATDAEYSAVTTIPVNQWSHVAFSWKNDSDYEVTIWINGIANTSTASFNGEPAAESSSLYIGNDSGQNNTFDGRIDDFRLYNYELSASQINQIMTGGSVRFD